MSINNFDYDIAIIGAGMVGCVFALLLKQQTNYRVCLIDPTPISPLSTHLDNRVSAMTPASSDLLASLGVWQHISAYQFNTVKVWDTVHIGQISFNANVLNKDSLGHIVANDKLLLNLKKSLLNAKIDSFTDVLSGLTKVAAGYLLTLNNTNLSTRLVVGADGANSKLRQLASITTTQFDYQQYGIVATLKSNIDFHQSIYQWFTKHGIIAILPIANKTCSIVWSLNQDDYAHLMSDKQHLIEQLNQHIGYYFGCLSLDSKLRAFPLKQQNTHHYVLPNLALIGDAAHNIHPLAGQGVNLGFLDAQSLVQVLVKNQHKTLGNLRTLRSYERAKMPYNTAISNLMSAFYWFNKIDIKLINSLLGLSINWLDTQTTSNNWTQSKIKSITQ